MRLKEDKSNWKASNVIRKQAQAPDIPIYRSRKDTKRWCRGKVGTEHDYYRSIKWEFGDSIFYVKKCRSCGKEKY